MPAKTAKNNRLVVPYLQFTQNRNHKTNFTRLQAFLVLPLIDAYGRPIVANITTPMKTQAGMKALRMANMAACITGSRIDAGTNDLKPVVPDAMIRAW